MGHGAQGCEDGQHLTLEAGHFLCGGHIALLFQQMQPLLVFLQGLLQVGPLSPLGLGQLGGQGLPVFLHAPFAFQVVV